MSEPPAYTPINFADIQKQADVKFQEYMQGIYTQINENIKKAVDKGLYKCEIFLNFGKADKDHTVRMLTAIKVNYQGTKPTDVKIKVKHHMNNIYKVTITWGTV